MRQTAMLLQLLSFGTLFWPPKTQAGRNHPATSALAMFPGTETPRRCESIHASLCRDVGYNSTSMPGLLGFELQSDANKQLLTFRPLLRLGCSKQLLFFLCSSHFPLCDETVLKPIGPCAGMCQAVHQQCAPLLRKFHFEWPESLNCHRFLPHNGPDHMCMESLEDKVAAEREIEVWNHNGKDTKEACRHLGFYHNRYTFVAALNCCVPRCDNNGLYPHSERFFIDVWMGLWSSMIFFIGIVTLLTFIVEPRRFPYPQRSFIFFTACHTIQAVAYLIRLAIGQRRASCKILSMTVPTTAYLPLNGLANSACATIFVLRYFSMMAAAAWWVAGGLTWYLATAYQWGAEALAAYAAYLHAAAWALPALQTGVVLVWRCVAPDALTALCYLGNGKPEAIAVLSLSPLMAFWVIGSGFYAVSLVCMRRIRASLHSPGTKCHQLQVQTVKLAAFSLLTAIPMVASVVCRFLQLDLARRLPGPERDSGLGLGPSAFIIASDLIPGAAALVWVASSKTLQTWRGFVSRTEQWQYEEATRTGKWRVSDNGREEGGVCKPGQETVV
uniref:frizzled-4-like isoform X1 n=1 Tax=Myxine glutinosa TaxID=7769 RepID=UPI0035900FB7